MPRFIDVQWVTHTDTYALDASSGAASSGQDYEIFAPAGKQIISVGWQIIANASVNPNHPVVIYSEPGSGEEGVDGAIASWQFRIHNNSGQAAEGSIVLFAICTDA